MKNLLKSTTSLGLSLALAFPHGAFAQEQQVPTCGPVGEATEFPCSFEEQTVEDADELKLVVGLSKEAKASGDAAAETGSTADAGAEAGVDANAEADANADANAESGSVLDTVTGAANSAAEAVTDTVDAAEEKAAETEAAATAEAEAAAQEAERAAQQAEADATAAAQANAKAQADASAEADAQREADAATEAAETTGESTNGAEAESAVTTQEEPAATAETETTATADAETTETQPVAEVQSEDIANGESDAVAETTMTDEQLQAREERREARREERRAQRRAEREAAAAAAAAAANESTAEAEVVTEEVTEADVRSSDEDFDTKVTAAGETAPAASNDDSGMSKFEKALLLGLGAVAVGSILKNGEKIVSRSGDRVVIQDPDGELRVLKDDNALIQRPGDQVQTQTFDDGSTRTIVTKADGSRIETIRSRDGSVLRRSNFDAQGREYILVDDLVEEREVIVSELPQVQEKQELRIASNQDEEALRRALQAEARNDQGRTFSLRQVREIREVRSLAPQLELDAVRFPTGSAAIQPEQARALANIGSTLRDMIEKDPRTVILVEGHTDAVGDASYNLALSDRRAETVALALTEYFDVPPANLVTQGYGESQLRVPTNGAEPANRRAVVRNISGLLRTQ